MARAGACGIIVDGPGDEFFTGSRFTDDEHGCVRLRDAADELENALHRLTGADDGFASLTPVGGRVSDGFAVGAAARDGRAQRVQEILEVDRLLDVVVRPCASPRLRATRCRTPS
jgi:hypothetical protein